MYCKYLSVQSIFVRALDWNVKESAYLSPRCCHKTVERSLSQDAV